MNYVFAFVLLMGIGLGVNYLMLRLFKKKIISSTTPTDQEDLLSIDTKEALAKDVQDLRTALTDLTQGIKEKYMELEVKQKRIEELIACADERIALLNAASSVDTLQKKENEPRCGQGSQRIHELYIQGMDATEIARSLGVGVGEIELRLGLMNKLR